MTSFPQAIITIFESNRFPSEGFENAIPGSNLIWAENKCRKKVNSRNLPEKLELYDYEVT